jgi:hypothetical protein
LKKASRDTCTGALCLPIVPVVKFPMCDMFDMRRDMCEVSGRIVQLGSKTTARPASVTGRTPSHILAFRASTTRWPSYAEIQATQTALAWEDAS